MSDDDRLEVHCPDCRATMIVDRRTGAVLKHRSAPKNKEIASFEDAFRVMAKQEKSREKRFLESVQAQEKRAEALSRQFENLVREAAEDDDGTPPPRPFDLD